MAEADADLIRIARDFTWLRSKSSWPRGDIGLTETRWWEYRALFEKLGSHDGIVRTEEFPGAVFIVLRAKGLCIAGSSSGYVYSEQPLTPTTESPGSTLDVEKHQHPDRGQAYVFRPLRPNWYAFYEVDW